MIEFGKELELNICNMSQIKKTPSKLFHSLIKDQTGQKFFEMKSVEAPPTWSQTAVDIAASKYFRKSVKQENSVFKLVDRICLGLRRAAVESKYFQNQKQATEFVEGLKQMILDQTAAFNSPVWFNCGLSDAYNLRSDSEHYIWSSTKKSVIKINDAYLHPQSSACFIQSIDDNLESIFRLVQNEAKLFKFGSGSGTNFSNLRSKFDLLNSGGTSSGLISFLEVLDKSAGAIKSGGVTRRAAKMVCVDVSHPEILDFINWKKNEEAKARVLIANGYSGAIDGEAYHTVSGQNANNSVRVTDRFMKAVINGKTWTLGQNRKNKHLKYESKLPAAKIWSALTLSAFECADPGIQFHDTINRFHTCSNTTKINASNPCSEYMFVDDSACNLASVNLVKILDSDLNFDLIKFQLVCRQVFQMQEFLIDFSSYPTESIALNSHQYRPLGLGFANLGSLLMRKGIAYDSDQGRAWAGAITAAMTGIAYRTSGLMAKELGAFSAYSKNKTSMLRVLKKHQASLKMIRWDLLPKNFKTEIIQIWNDVFIYGRKYGFRNAQATVIAPTGTIGLVMDCDTTGIEPDFSLIKYKKLSGGGEIKTTNQAVRSALNSLNYPKVQIDAIEQHLLKKQTLRGAPHLKTNHLPVFATAIGENCIRPEGHLLMMAAVQPFISGAISKTVNLPQSSTQDDISKIYKAAWRLGLKSVAIYRDGSKFVQPLSDRQSPRQTDKPTQRTSKELSSQNPRCGDCGFDTILEAGCFRCVNCGSTTACAG
jgi:ribonucleoside-diphosphate reductase alpha chain